MIIEIPIRNEKTQKDIDNVTKLVISYIKADKNTYNKFVKNRQTLKKMTDEQLLNFILNNVSLLLIDEVDKDGKIIYYKLNYEMLRKELNF